MMLPWSCLPILLDRPSGRCARPVTTSGLGQRVRCSTSWPGWPGPAQRLHRCPRNISDVYDTVGVFSFTNTNDNRNRKDIKDKCSLCDVYDNDISVINLAQ